ncbi:MAG: hypothetical protein HY906_25410, partial [Deltaproteobacteria bacterium]|nr:hypothetical protein [Deltaproteobacteria bacterium]
QVEGKSVVAGGPSLGGSLRGVVFEGLLTDATGYQATLVGRQVKPNRIEGTGCDNRGRSYSFTLTRGR